MQTRNMPLDVIAVLPFEILSFAAGNTRSIWIWATLLRSNRLVKTYKVCFVELYSRKLKCEFLDSDPLAIIDFNKCSLHNSSNLSVLLLVI